MVVTRLPDLLGLFPESDLKLFRLGKRDNPLDIQENPITIGIGLETKTPNIKTTLVEPKYRRCEFLGEVRRGQHHSDILSEMLLIGFAPSEELQQTTFSIIVAPDPFEMSTVDIYRFLEGHGRDHGSISQCLELHVSTALGPLQLNHDQVSLSANGKQIYPPSGLVPIIELLANDQEVRVENLDLIPDEGL